MRALLRCLCSYDQIRRKAEKNGWLHLAGTMGENGWGEGALQFCIRE